MPQRKANPAQFKDELIQITQPPEQAAQKSPEMKEGTDSMKTTCAILLLSVFAATQATAQSQGDWTIGLGLGGVIPKSGNGTLAGGEADINSNIRPTITAEYFVTDRLGVELLAAWPFEHDVEIAGIGPAGTIEHLPPTLSLNYHFPARNNVKPYVGVGVNYTLFSNETSPLGTIELDDSFGLAVQAGVDFALGNGNAFRANIRWIDIDADVHLNGGFIGKAEIDPVVVNFAYVIQF